VQALLQRHWPGLVFLLTRTNPGPVQLFKPPQCPRLRLLVDACGGGRAETAAALLAAARYRAGSARQLHAANGNDSARCKQQRLLLSLQTGDSNDSGFAAANSNDSEHPCPHPASFHVLPHSYAARHASPPCGAALARRRNPGPQRAGPEGHCCSRRLVCQGAGGRWRCCWIWAGWRCWP
jgi:hypothetical protein